MFLEQLVKVELAVAITSLITIGILFISGGSIPTVLIWVFGINATLTLLTTIYFRVHTYYQNKNRVNSD